MKVIYADDLLKEIEGPCKTTNHNVMWTDGYHTAIYDVKSIIENMPHVVHKSAPPVNRWISVHDMLPMEGMDVLICNFDEWCGIASYHGNHWEDDNGRCVPEYEITHWRELPALPKEEVLEDG